ncbi:CRAL-TRIO domain-containing protein [Sporodiniella umbellata]|nr:CRAL-TRIO domain-containing protein [Sporodiniella umbellata]
MNGYVHNLLPSQTDILKKLWVRLIQLFSKPLEGTTLGKQVNDDSENFFLGKTVDPLWLSLPLEKALLLIPGNLLQTTFWNMVGIDHPDAVVLRFLRAKKWELYSAYTMLLETLRWRLWMRVDDIVALGETGIRDELNRLRSGLGDCFSRKIALQKVSVIGPDEHHRPVCFIDPKDHHKEDQSLEVLKIYIVYMFETIRLLLRQPVETVCVIFHLKGFTKKNMDFNSVKFLIECFDSYYPEALGVCLIYKAPWVFSKIWRLIVPKLSPKIASKIRFADSTQALKKHICIQSLSDWSYFKKTAITRVKSLESAVDTLEYEEYWEMVEQFQAETLEWTLLLSQREDKNVRQTLAKEYRMSRIKAEKYLRGPNECEKRGLYTINTKGHLILDYGGDWIPLDVTHMV